MTIQTEIIGALNVSVSFEAPRETVGRTRFLSDYMERSGLRAFILGISGGIDFLTAGLLAQSAVRTLRERSYDSEFVAVRLPYGTQADEADAQLALQAIKPDRTVTINVKPATDNIWQEVLNAGLAPADPSERDLVLGNIKARQRMVAQFALAGSLRGLVIGTDHAAEAVMDFH